MKCFVLTKRKAILALSLAVCVAAGIVFGIHGAAANAQSLIHILTLPTIYSV